MSEKLIRPMMVSERLEMRLEGSPEPNNDNGYAMYPNWQLRIEIADTKALESSLAQAQADVEALRDQNTAFEGMLDRLAEWFERTSKDELSASVELPSTEKMGAYLRQRLWEEKIAPLPEHLRGASR